MNEIDFIQNSYGAPQELREEDCYTDQFVDTPYKIALPFVPPSVNSLYAGVQNSRILSSNGRVYQAKIIEHMQGCGRLPEKQYKITMWIQRKWRLKSIGIDGTDIMKADLDDRFKFLIDRIFMCMGLDDKWLWEIHAHKIHSTEEKSVILIEEWNSESVPEVP